MAGNMKALSVKQPWANAIASGEKTIETRTWRTGYRGELLVVSSKIPNIPMAGYALCIVTLIDCMQMKLGDEVSAMCPLYANAYSRFLRDVRRIDPFPVKGQLRLYEVELPEEFRRIREE